MRTTTFLAASIAVTALALAPATSHAQMRATMPAATIFEVTPYAGYLFSGQMLSGPLGSGVGPAPAPLIGTQLGMRIAPNISLVANLATGSSDVKAGVPILGGITVAQSRVVLYDAGVQLDIPVTSATGMAFSPFVQAGVGAMRYDITESFLTTTSTNLAGNVGLGADVSVGRGVGVRLMAKDYIGKFDAAEATSFDVNTNTTQNYAVSLGVRLSF